MSSARCLLNVPDKMMKYLREIFKDKQRSPMILGFFSSFSFHSEDLEKPPAIFVTNYLI
jgi:hypothetical protein